MVICPQCQGSKEPNVVFVNRGEKGCSVEQRPCSVCAGLGEITEYRANLMIEGRKVRDARASAGRSLHEFARLLGCSSPHLSDIEHGRADAHHETLLRRLNEWR